MQPLQVQPALQVVSLLLVTCLAMVNGRQLLFSKQPDFPPCVFHPTADKYYGTNASACVANDAYTVRLTRSQQHTPATRVYTQWRQYVVACQNHTSQASCVADTANYCMYNASRCTASPNLMQYLFSCTSEYAEAYYYCRVLGDVYGEEGCPSGPACFWNADFITPTDGNACYPYDLLAENPTIPLLDNWKVTTLYDFLNPEATMELYGRCPESMAFQQASAYAQTCDQTTDADTCEALDCLTAPFGAKGPKCGADGPRYYQMLVGGPPSGNVYKQWALCPHLDKKPKSCKNFNITYGYLKQ